MLCTVEQRSLTATVLSTPTRGYHVPQHSVRSSPQHPPLEIYRCHLLNLYYMYTKDQNIRTTARPNLNELLVPVENL